MGTINHVNELVTWTLRRNKQYDKSQIEFTSYCSQKIHERYIDRSQVISVLVAGKGLYYAELQMSPFRKEVEKRYKLVYKISTKYSFIIIVAYYEKVLKVINVIKTSKGAEKIWRKKILR